MLKQAPSRPRWRNYFSQSLLVDLHIMLAQICSVRVCLPSALRTVLLYLRTFCCCVTVHRGMACVRYPVDKSGKPIYVWLLLRRCAYAMACS